MTNLNLYILIIQTLVIVIIVVSFCFLCRMFTNFAEFYRVLTNIYFQSTTPTTTLHQLFPVFFLYILNIGSTFLPCMAQKRNPVTSLRFYKILWNSDIWWYLFYTSSLLSFQIVSYLCSTLRTHIFLWCVQNITIQ